MGGVFQLAVTLFAVLVYGKLATSFEDQWHCKQDILLILDTSYSIGKTNFDKNVKPFLQLLVSEERLNIAADGTHLAIMVFSEEKKTKIRLPFLDSGYDRNSLSTLIGDLDWDKLNGGHTRTDFALKKATDEVFPYDSPRNHRQDADDVIVLITDGHPQGIANAEEEAIKYANKLKDKKILIIGVAVGDAIKDKKYMDIIKSLSSPGQTLKAEFEDINLILDALVAKSCRNAPAFDCTCPPTLLGKLNPTPGHSTVMVNWKIPEPECDEVQFQTVTPNVMPGDLFPVGVHTVQYVYKVLSADILCNVSFEVRGQRYCKQVDILLILDMSTSIGKTNFDDNVKPFLKLLVSEERLNIAPDGTHLAIMLFSDKDKTKIRLPFLDTGYDRNIVETTINDLDWNKLGGGQTRTDFALEKAANEVFPYDSPQNHRQDADDVIVLITDGYPYGIANATGFAINNANKLKDKKILIIGVAVGDAIKQKQYMDTIKSLSSPGQTLNAEFEDINLILDALVAKSCRNAPAFDCTCPPTSLGELNPTPGHSTVRVNWKIPEPECDEVELHTVTPNVMPGDSFPVGVHTVQYVYKVQSKDIPCNVSFEVKGIMLCRKKAFTPTTQDCCCGALHEKKPGFKCCGVDYYSSLTKKCCPFFNVKNIEHSCAGAACTCPIVALGVTYTKPGVSSVPVRWTTPQPNCPNRLKTTTPKMTSGQSFSLGVYQIKYSYEIYERFEAVCEVHFQVKECSCQSVVLNPQKVPPGKTMMNVIWTTPRPSCSEAQLMIKPRERSGQYFPVGHHRVRYVYDIQNQFNMTCEVFFEIRGALCLDKGYNAANQVCCCGKIRDKMPGYACCGQDYYSTFFQKCCPNIGARYKKLPCPRQ